jgi:hypothetical protein
MLSTVIEVMSACTGEGATTMVAKVMNKQIGKNPETNRYRVTFIFSLLY